MQDAMNQKPLDFTAKDLELLARLSLCLLQ